MASALEGAATGAVFYAGPGEDCEIGATTARAGAAVPAGRKGRKRPRDIAVEWFGAERAAFERPPPRPGPNSGAGCAPAPPRTAPSKGEDDRSATKPPRSTSNATTDLSRSSPPLSTSASPSASMPGARRSEQIDDGIINLQAVKRALDPDGLMNPGKAVV